MLAGVAHLGVDTDDGEDLVPDLSGEPTEKSRGLRLAVRVEVRCALGASGLAG